MLSKFNYRLRRIYLSTIEKLEKGNDGSRCGIVSFNPKQKLDELLIRVILVGREEFKALPDFIQAVRIIDFRGKFIVGEFFLSELKKLAEQEEIVSIDLPGPLYDDLQEAMPQSGWNVELNDDLRNRLGLETHWDGTGVLIGIIDSGIDYRHDDFKDENGDTIIEWIYQKESEQWNRNQINEALNTNNHSLVPHIDRNGHGTAVAACAASTGIGTGNKGVAPGASLLVMAHTSGSLTNDDADNNYLEAIVRLKDYMSQDALNRPLVINLSKGDNTGPRDGSLAFEGWLDQFLTDFPRIAFCKTAGNDGDRKHHAQGNVQQDQTVGHPIFALTENPDSSTPFKSISVQIYYEHPEIMELVVVGPDGTESLLFDETIEPNDFRIGIIYQVFQVNAFVAFEQVGNTKKYQIEINLPDAMGSLPLGNYEFQLKTPGNNQSANGNYHMWWDYNGFSSGAQNRNPAFQLPHQSNQTTINAGGGGTKPFVIGAYDGLDHSLSSFSSRGPTRDGRLGVDLVAPGTGLIAASANVLGFGSSIDYSLWSGTSFSSPIVAGALALIMQKEIADNGQVSLAEQLKQRLKEFSTRDFFTGPIQNSNYGHGKLHVLSALYQVANMEPIGVHIELRPKNLLVGQTVECYLQLVDELNRPVGQNIDFEIYRGFGATNDLDLVANGTLETGGMLVALPLFEIAGNWAIEARVPSLNLSQAKTFTVHRFLPEFNTQATETSNYLQSGLTLQYYFDGSDDTQEFLEAFGFLLSSEGQSHHSLLKGVDVDYGYIDTPDFEFSDDAALNLQEVNEPISEQGLSFEPSLHKNDLFRIPLAPNFLYSGQRRLLLQIHITEKIGPLQLKWLPVSASHVQSKKWSGGNLIPIDESNGKQAPVWILDTLRKATDVWLKSGTDDLGIEPYVFPTFTQGSPDITVPFGFKVVQNNSFSVRIRNRGVTRANGAQVDVFWSENQSNFPDGDFPTGPWNNNYFFNANDGQTISEENPLIIDIEPDANFESEDEFQTISFIWNPPLDVLDGSNNRNLNFIVRISHADDPVVPTEQNLESISRSNNIAFKRFVILENNDLDLWFRANSRDDGTRDVPVVDNKNSPDILVKQNPSTASELYSSDPLIIGRNNEVYLKLRHRNVTEQNGATVSLFWSTQREGLIEGNLRSEYISRPQGDGFEPSNEQRIETILPFTDEYILVRFRINIPERSLQAGFDGKIYLIAKVSHRNDTLVDLPTENTYATENNVARNLVDAYYPIRPWIRDTLNDIGKRPTIGDFTNSPDIVAAAETLSDPFNGPGTMLRGQQLNHVYVRVHNRGYEVARSVRIHLFWLPGRNNGGAQDQWNSQLSDNNLFLENMQVVDEIRPKDSTIVHFTFRVSFARGFSLRDDGLYFIAKVDYEGNQTPGLGQFDRIALYDSVATKKVFFRRTIIYRFIAWILRFFQFLFFNPDGK